MSFIGYVVLLLCCILDKSRGITLNLPGTLQIAEDTTAANSNVFTPTASSSTGTILYSAAIQPADGKFRAHYNNGTLFYRSSPKFDFETAPEYTVELSAVDQLGSTTVTFTVTITNVNEKPIVTNLPASVAQEENSGGNVKLIDLTGYDEDNNPITYVITGVEPSSGTSKFTQNVASGSQIRVVLNPGFDHETVAQYNISIAANDGINGDSKILSVDIVDLNEAPFFNASVGLVGTCSYEEEQPIGTELNVVVPVTGKIQAYDVDANDIITYELDGANQQFFEVRTVGGEAKLYMRQVADYELRVPSKNFDLKVRGRDKKGLITEPAFTITMTIVNLNDNLPVCSPSNYSATVTENMAAGSSILTMTCSDEDGTLDGFQIDENTQPNVWFEGNGTTGELRIKSPPDYEKSTVLTFPVYAVQGLPNPQTSTSVSVTITVLAANDNKPRFLQTFYDFDIRADAAIAASVGQVSAVDADTTTTALTYDWVATILQFRLDPVDGRIRVQAAMTDNTRYVLFVVAKDTEVPPDRSDHVPVRIDAFPPAPYLLDITVSKPISYFTDARIADFLAAISAACSPCVGRYSTMRSTPGEESTKTTLTVYALKDATTHLFTNIETNKYYIPKADMLAIFTTDDAGTPSSATTTTGFHPYPVTKVVATYSSLTAGEWLTQTSGGIAVLTLLCLGVVGGIVGGAIALAKSGLFNQKPLSHNIRRPEQLNSDDLFDYRYREDSNVTKRY